MLRVVLPLREMGAEIMGRDGGRFAPLAVQGRPLRGASHRLEQASAQVKTCILLAGLAADGTTSVSSPAPSRDHTERMLRHLGVPIEGDQVKQTVGRTESLPGERWRVPADPSSAMFLLAAASLIPGSDIEIRNVSLNPLRIGAFEVLRSMGGDIEWSATGQSGGEPVGNVRAGYAELHGVEITPEVIPTLIDEIPVLAILAAFASGTTHVSGAGELKVKESDRIAAITDGLRSVGGVAEAHDDGFSIEGGHPLDAAVVEARGDHRIAMSFAVAGLAASANITIRGWSSVATSFPGFLETMKAAQRG
jgi:3-phosphoshikimate 1-carboxyvinyltransferase